MEAPVGEQSLRSTIQLQVDQFGQRVLLHSFQGGQDGAFPYGGLISDKKGNLYGSTYGYWDDPSDHGTIFRVTPPSGNSALWTEGALYVFKGLQMVEIPLPK